MATDTLDLTPGASLRDEKYYEVAPPSSLAERVVAVARDRIHADFLRLCRPGPETTILDVGVSDVLNDAANVLERTYPHRANITAVGLGSAEAFREAYPEIAYRQVSDDCRLPFADGSFDVAVSNAVLEHVGSRQNQRLMLAEMARVARSVFVTVPHRFFPIEHHTAVPFLHYTDAGFQLACRLLGKSDWTQEQSLILMTRRRLAEAVPPGRVAEIGRTGIPLGPFSSNLYLHIA
ncbi:class I SAM-dependent methyltransferase [Methylobacterium sp. C25]|uniref:class I SAM-dependent methyltransferase n=1 Tax=Methylobacterium sp. C25 TaxID=2721622 RepID=UPI001F36B813|nr:methyltransferase domain-containing protein [Methylobacterium sp. C25]